MCAGRCSRVPVKKDELKVWRRRDRRTQLTVWAGYLVGTMVFVWCWQLMSEETFWDFVLDAPRQAGDMTSRMVPPKWDYINIFGGPYGTPSILPLWEH